MRARPCAAVDPLVASQRNDDEMPTTLDRQRRRPPLASGSVREHLFRGAAGLTTAALAIVLLPVVGPVALVLLPVTAFAWRAARPAGRSACSARSRTNAAAAHVRVADGRCVDATSVCEHRTPVDSPDRQLGLGSRPERRRLRLVRKLAPAGWGRVSAWRRPSYRRRARLRLRRPARSRS